MLLHGHVCQADHSCCVAGSVAEEEVCLCATPDNTDRSAACLMFL